MSVLLPDGEYVVIPNVGVLTDAGATRRGYDEGSARTFTGMRVAQSDPSNWHISLEPEAWPVARKDLIRMPGGLEVVVTEAQYRGPADPTSPLAALSYVYVEGRRRDAPQQPQ